MTILATLSHFECSERDAYAIGVFESSRSAFDGHYPGNLEHLLLRLRYSAVGWRADSRIGGPVLFLQGPA